MTEKMPEHNQRMKKFSLAHPLTELMTLEEAATYLRVNKKTIYRMLEAGEIPATRVGRQYRFSRRAIDVWLTNESSRSRASILVIDDDEEIRELFKDTLEDLGHKVTTIGSSSEGLELVKRQDFDLLFLDLKMPEIDGAEVFRQTSIIKPNLPVIIITGYQNSDLMARAVTHGPFAVMNKPFSVQDIRKVLDLVAIGQQPNRHLSGDNVLGQQ